MNGRYYIVRDYVPRPGLDVPPVVEVPTRVNAPTSRHGVGRLAATAQLTDSASLADAIEAIGGRASMHGPHCFDDGVPVCGFPEYHR